MLFFLHPLVGVPWSGPGADAPVLFPTNPGGFPTTRNEGTNMPVIIACPSCRSRLKVPRKLARSGKPLNCPKCRAPVTIPNTGPTSDAEYDVEPVAPAPAAQPLAPVPAVVTCPHCQGQVQNEPTLAGQVVTCPYTACGGQFLMPASIPAAAIATPATVQHPGSVRVSVLVTQRGRALYGQIVPDVGAVVLLFPKGVRVDIPWPAVVPSNWNLSRHRLPSHLQTANFSQAHTLLRRADGNAGIVAADGQAYLSPVKPGDYVILIVSNIIPDGLHAISVRAAREGGYQNYPGVEIGETLLDRYFGLGIANSEQEELFLRHPLRRAFGHEGQLTVFPGEETPYEFTF